MTILIDNCEVKNFTAIITGNDGEDQMVIVSSPYGAFEDLFMVSAHVQGGAALWRAGRLSTGEDALMEIERHLVSWCADGQKRKLTIVHAQRIADVLRKLRKEWYEDA